MADPPHFPPGYREDRVHLVDLDGDGCADVVYRDYDGTRIWLNQVGGGFGPPIEIPVTPGLSGTPVLEADLFGDGRPSFAWTGSVSTADSAGYRFLRFDEGRKAYLMTGVENGIGGRYEIEYTTSTSMRLADAMNGQPWSTQVPFVVHVVSAIHERDLVSGRVTDLMLRYRDAVYDGLEREFHGFSRVTVDMPGDDSIPSSRQEFSFIQGDLEDPDPIERARSRALVGLVRAVRLLERGGDTHVVRDETAHGWGTRIEHHGADGIVVFPFLSRIERTSFSTGDVPSRVERTTLEYDDHGNVSKRRREYLTDDLPANELGTEERSTFTQNEGAWLVKLPVRSELRDADGVPLAVTITHYDGPAFVGLDEGQVEHGLPSRVRELALLESRLPTDYLGGRDLAALGYAFLDLGDARGFYATMLAVKRDDHGNVVERRDPLGESTTVTFDDDGVHPTKQVDALGRVTELAFDPRFGEPSLAALPDGRRTRFERDDAGEEQLLCCWTIDLASTPVSTTSIAPRQPGHTRADFASISDVSSIVDAHVSRVYYSGFGAQAHRVSTGPNGPDGERRWVAEPRERINPRQLTSVRQPPRFVSSPAFEPPPDPDESGTRTRYDVQGRIVETSGPGPAHFLMLRDPFSVRHFEGASAGPFGSDTPTAAAARVERYDARDRLVRIDDHLGDGSVISSGYDLTPDNRVQVVRDGDGAALVQYTFAGGDQPIRIAHRDVGSRTYYRDAAGRLVEMIVADGSTFLYEYDLLGRPTRVRHQPVSGEAVAVREIVYDADPTQPPAGTFLDGRIARISEGVNETRYSYNRAGQVVQESVTVDGVTLTLGRTYDFQQRLGALTFPDGHQVTYVRDDSGAVQQVTGLLSDVRYQADGTMLGYTAANGMVVSSAYDPSSRRLTEIAAHGPAGLHRRLSYTYDAVGNTIQLRDETPADVTVQSFDYDGLHRLAHVELHLDEQDSPPVQAGDYSYDALGNIQQIADPLPRTLTYADPAHPGLTTAVDDGNSVQPISYDARANIVAIGDQLAVEYDPHDRVARVSIPGAEVRLQYDAQSHRLLKDVVQNGATKRVRYLSNLFELHDDHAVRAIYLGDALVAREVIVGGVGGSIEVSYFLADHHGSLIVATDDAGAIVGQQPYSAFGSPLVSATPFARYVGRERDPETGLIHLGVRHSAPWLGRFTSPDWYVLENPDRPFRMPQGFNPYSYSLNNPLVFRDPSGRWFFLGALAVGFVAGVVHGLSEGQGWQSVVTGLETAFTVGVGSLLGGAILGSFGALMGGLNGYFAGTRGIYRWSDWTGWAAFGADSTTGIVGTSLGNLIVISNQINAPRSYRGDLSRRENRQVYERGFYLTKDGAATVGNVISHLRNPANLERHETIHIWQSRAFGPVYQHTYLDFLVGGAAVAVLLQPAVDQSLGDSMFDLGYLNNPWELWAYGASEGRIPSGREMAILRDEPNDR